MDIPNLVKNLWDALFVLIGIFQSRRILKQVKPRVIFSRGSYISVPVCLAAKRLAIPYITHDSDPVPSLTNRLIAKGAALHAVALPKALYPYPEDKTVTTGIPLSKKFTPVSAELKQSYREEIKLPEAAKLLFVIGGGQGSQTVNESLIAIAGPLLNQYPDLHIIHGVGRANEEEAKAEYASQLNPEALTRVQVFGFIKEVYKYSGAADIVITRAGATNLAEFALQGKPCIVIPSAFLVAGHQLKNAQYLKEQGAAIVLSEEAIKKDPNRLAKQIDSLLGDKARRDKLASNLEAFARPGAAEKIAKLIIETGSGDGPKA